MNTTLHRSITHPPDIEDRQVLQIPAPGELRELALVDRLSLRIGVWLLQRAQRPRPQRTAPTITHAEGLLLGEQNLTARHYAILLAHDLQRQLR
ncbi:hypothetical protein [Microbacterium sp. SD291]|uniref:hypothetical protein n=1 Tax=Microbacterium sp. SD291 TaxID=2782007 RepID=UPI001A970018|nr:hypothetical protein [Microbacterium sp. SD291]MBO0979447.1 hypothetical protein [Microbacterium sp. SD291]